MTAVQDAPPAPPRETTAGQVAGRRWRRSRGVLIAVVALVLLGIVLAALRPRVRPEFLDPESPGQQGTKALVEITRQHGTQVDVARSASSAAEKTRERPDTVLVVVRPERLLPSDLDTLKSTVGDKLLIKPDQELLQALAPGVRPAGVVTGTPEPGCSLTAATYAGNVHFVDSTVYDTPGNATGCYLSAHKPGLVQVAGAGGTVTVLGSGEALTNERLTESGNAALGMNLVGARSHAVWLIPDPPPPTSEGARTSLTELLPFGVKLGVLQLVIAVVLVAFWRARRLGPVVAEPLPVVVRSAEAVEGRARLYRARGATDRAALALRMGALERLVGLLGMPRSAATDPSMAAEIVSAVAAHTGRDHALIGAALYGPPPADDAGLVGLSGFLDDLERQVRNS